MAGVAGTLVDDNEEMLLVRRLAANLLAFFNLGVENLVEFEVVGVVHA